MNFQERLNALSYNIERVIRGKTEVVQLSLVCLLSEGHLLLEDVPGVGKTMLARSIAASIRGSWKRIQFTPDLLPSDVTGVSIYDQRNGQFEFHPGPVFANLVLADEVNRASPKTQSALLEVMEERQVTVDGVARQVQRPFMVMATQNPIELEGTYRLPEAQLDRFLMKTSIGAPDVATEVAILKQHSTGTPVEELEPVLTADDIAIMIQQASTTFVSDGVFEYIARIAAATRSLPELRLGVSPRGSLGLVRASRTLAAALGRDHVVPDDVIRLVEPVLAHRLVLSPEAELRGQTAAELLARARESVPVPQRRASV